MDSESYDMRPVDAIGVATEGEPGQRRFFLQVVAAGKAVTAPRMSQASRLIRRSMSSCTSASCSGMMDHQYGSEHERRTHQRTNRGIIEPLLSKVFGVNGSRLFREHWSEGVPARNVFRYSCLIKGKYFPT